MGQDAIETIINHLGKSAQQTIAGIKLICSTLPSFSQTRINLNPRDPIRPIDYS